MKGLIGLAALAVLWMGTGAAHAGEVSDAARVAAARDGGVRVLAMLRDDTPAKASDAVRTATVAAGVDAVVATLPKKGHTVARRFALVPAVAIVADSATLEALARDPRVLRVDIDAPGAGHGVADTAGAGPSARRPRTPAVPPPTQVHVYDAATTLNGLDRLATGGYSTGGRKPKVAVIDSGVDTDHPDLVASLLDQQCFCSSANGVGGCCPNGTATQSGAGAAEDNHGHGSNVSGIIVGAGKVAPRGSVPNARLIAVKVLDANNSFCCTSDVVASLDWLATAHPDVKAVNLSLGTFALFQGHCDAANAFTQAMATAVNTLVDRGVAVTLSSGNQGNSTSMAAPACVQKAVSVGATWDFTGGARTFLGCSETSTSPRQPTCFTNRSTTTDLYGAGAFVTAAGLNGGMSTFGGTSQAAPATAACFVALAHAFPNSTLAQRNEAILLSQTRVTDAVSGRSYPHLDCLDAMRLLRPATPPGGGGRPRG